MSTTYTFVGLREGSAPAVDIQVHGVNAGWVRLARAFLVEHTTCDRVEVWREQELIATLSRRDLDEPVGHPQGPDVERVGASSTARDYCRS